MLKCRCRGDRTRVAAGRRLGSRRGV